MLLLLCVLPASGSEQQWLAAWLLHFRCLLPADPLSYVLCKAAEIMQLYASAIWLYVRSLSFTQRMISAEQLPVNTSHGINPFAPLVTWDKLSANQQLKRVMFLVKTRLMHMLARLTSADASILKCLRYPMLNRCSHCEILLRNACMSGSAQHSSDFMCILPMLHLVCLQVQQDVMSSHLPAKRLLWQLKNDRLSQDSLWLCLLSAECMVVVWLCEEWLH